jgi:hypothetical protein
MAARVRPFRFDHGKRRLRQVVSLDLQTGGDSGVRAALNAVEVDDTGLRQNLGCPRRLRAALANQRQRTIERTLTEPRGEMAGCAAESFGDDLLDVHGEPPWDRREGQRTIPSET